MKRTLWLTGSLLLALTACQLPPEQGVPLRPLPEDGPPLPYAELLTRARYQERVAVDAYYADHWAELEDSARGLQQTARYLAKAQDVPPNHKDTLPVMSGDLAKEADKLLEAAKAKDTKAVDAAMTRVHAVVRSLKLEN
jgi:hypothetical protein